MRNTFGSTFHPDTGDLWSTENGPDDNDEINRLVRTGNYGWPNVGGIANNPAYVNPLVAYTPTIAPTGIVALRPTSAYPLEYQYNLFVADWKNGKVQRIILTGPGLTQLGSLSVAYNGGNGGLVAMTQGLDGYIYVSSTNAIYRLVLAGNQAPTVVSVSPASGNGLAQLFTFTFSDPDGFADLPAGEMLFSTSLNAANACYLRYSRTANNVSLRNDTNTAWMGPVSMGSGATLENTQCRFHSAGSSSSGSNNNLTVSLNMVFKPAFTGSKQVYLQTQDASAQATGWQQRGVWTVVVVAEPPSAVSVTPSSGTGSSQVFSSLFSDSNGVADLPWAETLIHSGLSSVNGCYLRYEASFNAFYLRNDASTAWLGPATPGLASTLENSQCAVNAAPSSVTAGGNNLRIDAAIAFKPAFVGIKNVYLRTQDGGGAATGWQNRGSWMILPASNFPPSPVSVTPAAGSGFSQIFRFLFSDTNGFRDIRWTQMVINSALNYTGGCYVHYNPFTNALLRRNDAGNAWLTPVTLGTAGIAQNSQCAINAGTSFTGRAGNNLTVNLALTLKPAFAGSKAIYMLATDNTGGGSGWQGRGTWSVPFSANLAPSAVSVSPASGAGPSQAFSLLFSDPNGAADLSQTEVLINTSASPSGACYVRYERAFNTLFLRNDASTGWLGPASLGLPTTLQNSQCAVNAALSSAVSSVNNLTVNVSLSFKPAFAGGKTVYLQTQDGSGAATGWLARGLWTVP